MVSSTVATLQMIRLAQMVKDAMEAGFHNAAESYYGTPYWNCYWSQLGGNGKPAIDQSTKANRLWHAQLANGGMLAFDSCYPSPLSRCTTTANLTLASLALHTALPCIPLDNELLREGISIHMRYQRYHKMYIQNVLVDYYRFEGSFIE
ncbi:phosphoglycerate mutase-like protein [Apiospora sp. TS-2023a]